MGCAGEVVGPHKASGWVLETPLRLFGNLISFLAPWFSILLATIHEGGWAGLGWVVVLDRAPGGKSIS